MIVEFSVYDTNSYTKEKLKNIKSQTVTKNVRLNEHVGEVSPCASSKESATPSAGDTPATPPNCHMDSILLTQNQRKFNQTINV